MENAGSPKKLAGRYEVREILGRGGMGLVYRAYDTVVRREVAVKTILDSPDSAALELFYKECDVLASMSHPNIVEIFDIGEFEEDGKKKPYFVMPLLPGTTLDHFIRKASHRLTVERAVEIIFQTCRGLQAAHERGLVHRDLKPSNIFVMEDDSVKIIDFGVAHMADAHTTRAQKGTLLYMSPEQLQMKPLSAASDIFSLSVVCYEALTGQTSLPAQPRGRSGRCDPASDSAARVGIEFLHRAAHQPGRQQRHGQAVVASLRQRARVGRHAGQGPAQRAHRVFRSRAHASAAAAGGQGVRRRRSSICLRNSGRAGGRRPHGDRDRRASPAAGQCRPPQNAYAIAGCGAGPLRRRGRSAGPAEIARGLADRTRQLHCAGVEEQDREPAQRTADRKLVPPGAAAYRQSCLSPTRARHCRTFCNCGPRRRAPCSCSPRSTAQEQEYNKLRQEKEQLHAPPWTPGKRATSAARWPSWAWCWSWTARRRIRSIAKAARATRVSTTKCAPSTTP